MKTKIIMMTALLALLAAGCGKNNGDGRIRIFAENMTAAGNGSKLQINAADPVNSLQWLAGEKININGTSYAIGEDGEGHYQLDISSVADPTLYAVYPGESFGNNDVAVTNSGTTATITLNSLALSFYNDAHGDLVHSVVFPMGAKASAGDGSMYFKNLTAAFRLTLNTSTTPVTLKKLKVIVYGTGAASAVALDGVSYTVKWAGQAPSVPTGDVGSITDRDVTYASEMYFDLLTGSTPGVQVDGDLQLCIPVTLATVKRITVVGYDDSDAEVFSTTSAMNGGNVTLERSRMYPVAKITIN